MVGYNWALTALLAAYASATLPQDVTNGGSTLGVLDIPTLRQYTNATSTSLNQTVGLPWGGATVKTVNPYNVQTMPNTGKTRYYHFEVANITLSPDGVQLPMLAVNDQFPGPMIEANWGDWIQVTVKNNLVTEGTSMHWHGFLQTGTPWFDGVPGVSQCPIPPMRSMVYTFRAELYGTSWWHSHYSGQYLNGVSGPIVIHGPTSATYDLDLGPVMLSDWFHVYYTNLIDQVFVSSPDGPVYPPASNNMLINGKNNYPCASTNLPCTDNAGVSQFRFHSGKKHLLRLINHSAESIIFFSIDGYNMTVIANDFVSLTPYVTDLVTLAVGQRTDVIVEAIGSSTDAVWMRINQGPSGIVTSGPSGCSLNDGVSTEALGAIYYENADTSELPTTESQIDGSRYLYPAACQNDALALTVPSYPIAPSNPESTTQVVMTGSRNSTGQFVWYMNNVTYYADWRNPALSIAETGNLSSYTPQRQIYNYGSSNSVRLVISSIGFRASHPMHIHGHNFYVLAVGTGTWDGSIANPSNPQRRDTQLLPPEGYLVIQLDLTNPGVWPFHCHIAWHVSQGMNINILELPQDIPAMAYPASMAQNCKAWNSWTNGYPIPEIDSGV